MKDIFVPYSGKVPAAVSINGHRLLILSNDKQEIEENLEYVGADCVKRLKRVSSIKEQNDELSRLAESAKCGVVLAPNDLHFTELVKNLESELPWVQ